MDNILVYTDKRRWNKWRVNDRFKPTHNFIKNTLAEILCAYDGVEGDLDINFKSNGINTLILGVSRYYGCILLYVLQVTNRKKYRYLVYGVDYDKSIYKLTSSDIDRHLYKCSNIDSLIKYL